MEYNMEIYGIDVSHHQGNIDWEVVAKTGIDFAFIKAGGSEDGIYKESMFETNYAGAKAAGLNVGAYYYVGPNFTSEEAGIADAERFIKILEGKTFEMPVALDLESNSPEDKAGATSAAIAFCNRMEEAGYYVVIYGADIFNFKDRMEIDRLADYDKWVARYGGEPQYVHDYGIWQYSSTDYIDGITENSVDKNVAYKNYPEIIKSRGLNGFESNIVDKSEGEEIFPEYSNDPKDVEHTTYTIQDGDTLSGIAEKFGTTVDRLAELNDIDNPDLIFPGVDLIIELNSSETYNSNTVESTTYTIQSGDTLSEIAEKFGTSVNRLVELNGIENPDLIYPGTILSIG